MNGSTTSNCLSLQALWNSMYRTVIRYFSVLLLHVSSWQRSLQRLVGVKRKCLLSISCIIEKRKKIPEASLHFAQIRGSKDKGNWLVTSRRKLFPTSQRSYVTDTSYISEMYRVKNTKFSLRVKKTFASIFWKCSQKYMEMDFRLIVVENLRKSIIQHCERSELRLHFFKWTKIH